MRPIQSLLIGLIKLYRLCISPLMAYHCRFMPTCSCYAIEALQTHSVLRGLWYSVRRLLRCHPWHRGGYDPVPAKREQKSFSFKWKKGRS